MRLAQLRREIVAATSARGVGSPRPHLHPDCAHPAPRPQLQQDRAHPCHISAGTGLTPATSAPGLLPARSAVNQRSPAHPHKCDIPDGAIMDGMISRTAWYAPPLFQRPRAVLRRPPRTVALGAASERSHATPWHAACLRTYRYSWGTRGTQGPPPLTARSLAMLHAKVRSGQAALKRPFILHAAGQAAARRRATRHVATGCRATARENKPVSRNAATAGGLSLLSPSAAGVKARAQPVDGLRGESGEVGLCEVEGCDDPAPLTRCCGTRARRFVESVRGDTARMPALS
jgi:hypothetical protein